MMGTTLLNLSIVRIIPQALSLLYYERVLHIGCVVDHRKFVSRSFQVWNVIVFVDYKTMQKKKCWIQSSKELE